MENTDIFNLNVIDAECDNLSLKNVRRSQVEERSLISACLGQGYSTQDLQDLVTEINKEVYEELGDDAEIENKAPVVDQEELNKEIAARKAAEQKAAEEAAARKEAEEALAKYLAEKEQEAKSAPEPEPEPEPVVEAAPVSQADDNAEEEQEEKEIRREGNVLFEISYNWSFRARLANSGDDMKARYNELYNIFLSYGLKLKESWKKARVFEKGITYVQLLFKGKTLCVAFALDPNEYEDTKYVFENVGHLKNYIATPMLVRLTSDRQMRNVKELLGVVFDGRTVKDVAPVEFIIPYQTKQQLVAAGNIKEIKNIIKE